MGRLGCGEGEGKGGDNCQEVRHAQDARNFLTARPRTPLVLRGFLRSLEFPTPHDSVSSVLGRDIDRISENSLTASRGARFRGTVGDDGRREKRERIPFPGKRRQEAWDGNDRRCFSFARRVKGRWGPMITYGRL